MATVRLVCWDDAGTRAASHLLRTAGFHVVDGSLRGAGGIVGRVRDEDPDAVVIDLERMPSFGREVANVLRNSKSTRHLPIVFAGGAVEKVSRIKAELPDARFCEWAGAVAATHAAIKAPPLHPISPPPHMERFKGSSLPRKLDIKANTRAVIVSADDALRETIGELPEGALLRPRIDPTTTLALFVVRSLAELESAFALAQAKLSAAASLWIIHPKQSSQYRCDFNQNDVRSVGLAGGFVDYKVCAVDRDWSGLKFARKRAKAAGANAKRAAKRP
jgi:CheY-like chemotaxis protein